MPSRIYLPNYVMKVRFAPSPMQRAIVAMPAAGKEGTFRTDVLTIDTTKNLTKIEMKNFLEATYGFHIAEVRSLNRMGRRRNDRTMMPRAGKDIKRFYVRLTSMVDVPNVPKRSLLDAL